jgi:protein-disulfide isomerase
VKVVFKHHPLDNHKEAPLAHAASMAANKQGRFWEYHDKLFENPRKLKRPDLLAYAAELQLDVARFEQDLDSPQIKQVVDSDKKEAIGIGATGTPAFFINGRYLRGAKPFEDFAKMINAELTRLNLPIPAEAATG